MLSLDTDQNCPATRLSAQGAGGRDRIRTSGVVEQRSGSNIGTTGKLWPFDQGPVRAGTVTQEGRSAKTGEIKGQSRKPGLDGRQGAPLSAGPFLVFLPPKL